MSLISSSLYPFHLIFSKDLHFIFFVRKRKINTTTATVIIKEDFIENEEDFWSRKVHDNYDNLWQLEVLVSNNKDLLANICLCEGTMGEYEYTIELVHENPCHTLFLSSKNLFQKNSKAGTVVASVDEIYGKGFIANKTLMVNYSIRPSELFFLDESKPFRKLSKTKMIFCFGNVP